MSIQWIDGFDEYGITSSPSGILTASGYLAAGGGNTVNNPARTGNALELAANANYSNYLTRYVGEKNHWIVGFGMYFNGSVRNTGFFGTYWYDGINRNPHFMLRRNNVNGLEIRIGEADNSATPGTLVAASVGEVIKFNTWHFIEVEYIVGFGGSTDEGMVKVSVDNVCVILASGINTTVQSTHIANTVSWNTQPGSFGGEFIVLDDLYIIDPNDATGNVTQLGDCRVYTLFPNAPGDTTQFSVTGAGANWQAVDDLAPDDDATYVQDATSGNKDLYNMQDIPAGVIDVFAVQVNARAKKTDAGARQYQLLAKLSGATIASSAINPSLSYQGSAMMMETKPGGGTWTPTDVTNMQAGVEVV